MAMMTSAPARAHGRRALDAAINLVPFIDLLSCCIAFLLITAVWSAVARLDVATGASGAAPEASGPPPWTLRLARDGWMLRAPDGSTAPVTQAELTATLRLRGVLE
jgi:biopolymer transport protein ExbD